MEIGTGVGAGTCWLLEGMDAAARLITVELDAQASQIAQTQLAADPRVTFVNGDAAAFLTETQARFDLIFADSFPGKFTHLDEALALLQPGGLYVIDDLLPQPTWDDDHAPKVARLIAELEQRADLQTVQPRLVLRHPDRHQDRRLIRLDTTADSGGFTLLSPDHHWINSPVSI